MTLFYDGHEHQFSVAPNQTILEAALDLKIDLPYSCQMGICMSCLGRCTSDQVQMDEEASLSVAERQANYVLTCVAHPVGQYIAIAIDWLQDNPQLRVILEPMYSYCLLE